MFSYDMSQTANGQLNNVRLTNEISQSAISTTLLGVSSEGTSILIDFAGALSASEFNLLDVIVGNHDGSPDAENVAPQQVEVVKQDSNPPFADKVLPNGSKLFRREHGLKGAPFTAGSESKAVLHVPYTACKITSIELVNAKEEYELNFKLGMMIDAENYVIINQFGFDVNTPNGLFVKDSNYDADLVAGLVVEITAKHEDNAPEVGYRPRFNVELHEVV